MKSTVTSGLFAEGRSEPSVSRLNGREGVAPGDGAGAATGRSARAMPEARYRYALPQLGDAIFLTDGGLETTLIFQDGFELPHFAAFDLLASERGRRGLRAYYERYAAMARSNRLGLVLESPTWRANIDWASRLGYDRARLADANREAIALMVEVRDAFATQAAPMVISGNIGPRGDGYDPGRPMSAEQAEAYHAEQVSTFADTAADMVAAVTMTNVEEAVGVTRAAVAARMPVAISFTVETDGRLPTGQSLADAVLTVDRETGAAPAYYMINCAHPTHFAAILEGAPWTRRLRGLRANASSKSHAELDAAPELDPGDPVEFGRQYRALRQKVRGLTILGGCCGTDHRHIEQIRLACIAA